jgi:hypothetical protein
MHGWGFDDQDLYNRLEDNGIEHAFFDLNDIRDIPHEDNVRGGARLADDFQFQLPPQIRRDKGFQNTRNKLLAGLIPWNSMLGRKRILRKTSSSTFECVLEPRSQLELRSQLVSAFLASRFYTISDDVEQEVRKALIDERMGEYTAKAIAQVARAR